VSKFHLDRRIIYAAIFLSVLVPLLFKVSLKPVKLDASERLYQTVEGVERREGAIALLSFDFGPSTKAENEPQAEVILEHLMRRRIPVAIFSLTVVSQPFLTSVPERVIKRLQTEIPGESWEYGKDWVNLGYRPGAALFIQALAKSDDLPGYLSKDANGTQLSMLPLFKGVKTIADVNFLGEFTGSLGMLDTYIQFFQRKGYTPIIGHGCTSITIPEAYIYLDSGQLKGLLEGVSGAAWYSQILLSHHSNREKDSALLINTALGVSQLVIILLIVLGNVFGLLERRRV